MKKKLILMTTVLTMLLMQPAFATQLPPEIKNYVLQSIPNSTIRFDGLITLPDGTFYLPLIPALQAKPTEFGVKDTYPAKKNFAQKPDIIVFNNNYCLLKLIKNKTGLTVNSMDSFPIEVRSGILPQDLLVPKGLVLPDSLIGVLGDLDIPLSSNLKFDPAKLLSGNLGLSADLPSVPKKVDVISQLKDKQFFITNFNSDLLYIMPADMRDVQYTLKLDSIPKTVKSIEGKFLFVATNGKTYIDVVDVQNEEIAKQIDLGVEADEILITKDEKTAYVISNHSSNLYVIDIPTMSLVKQIQIKGLPEKLNFSVDETKLVYRDSETEDIYTVELNNNYVNIYQCTVPNTSKIVVLKDKVYVLSRTRNLLKIYPYQEFVVEQTAQEEDQEVMGNRKSYYIKSALVATGSATKNFFKKEQEKYEQAHYIENGEEINIGVKPVDMVYYNNRLFVLSATNNAVSVFNPETKQIEKTIPLMVTGFSNKFNETPNTNIVLVTNVVDKQYVVLDLNKQAVLQVNPMDLPITTLTVVNKTKNNAVKKKDQVENTVEAPESKSPLKQLQPNITDADPEYL